MMSEVTLLQPATQILNCHTLVPPGTLRSRRARDVDDEVGKFFVDNPLVRIHFIT